ncbi:MAG: hypothetical protein WDZ47_00965 [Bacteroidales bacterium]
MNQYGSATGVDPKTIDQVGLSHKQSSNFKQIAEARERMSERKGNQRGTDKSFSTKRVMKEKGNALDLAAKDLQN